MFGVCPIARKTPLTSIVSVAASTVLLMRAPVTFPDRLQSFLLLAPWIVKHFRRMMKDVLIAADQVLYKLQMSQMKETDLREARKSA